RVRIDRKHSGHGPNAQPFSQGGHRPHKPFGRRAFAMHRHAMSLEEIRTACDAVELPPGSTARMAVGAQVAQARPAIIGTAGMGAEMALGVHLARASPGGGEQRWRSTRGSLGLRPVLTGGTQRLVGEPWKRLVRLRTFRGPLGGLAV